MVRHALHRFATLHRPLRRRHREAIGAVQGETNTEYCDAEFHSSTNH
jgi:hypothetical protein